MSKKEFEFKELTTFDMSVLSENKKFMDGDQVECVRALLELSCPELIEIYENYDVTIFETLSAEEQSAVVNTLATILEKGVETMNANIGSGANECDKD